LAEVIEMYLNSIIHEATSANIHKRKHTHTHIYIYIELKERAYLSFLEYINARDVSYISWASPLLSLSYTSSSILDNLQLSTS
jgi:hypothetical protein